MRTLSSAGSCCHSSVRHCTSPRSSLRPPPQGERLHWAHPEPSWGIPETSYLSSPSQLENQTCKVGAHIHIFKFKAQVQEALWKKHFVHFCTHSCCPWWGRSRCCGFWCSWGSWWTPPLLCCGWTPALPWSTGSSVGSPAKRNPADRCTRSNSGGRRVSRMADTSHHQGRESAAVPLRDDVSYIINDTSSFRL